MNQSLQAFLRDKKWRQAILVLIIVCINLGAAFSQITLFVKNQSITQVFNRIEKQSDYIFLYDNAVKSTPAVSLDCEDCSIQQVIDRLEKATDLEFKVSDKQILVKKKAAKQAAAQSTVKAERIQQDSIRGRVLDDQGNPIVGASLIIKGTKIGTTTNNLGEFVVPKLSENQRVIIQCIGFRTKEQQITSTTRMIAIRLEVEAMRIEDVVIHTGLQSREKSKMIGNVSSIKGEDLEAAGVTSIDKALRGKMTGVYVRSNSGRPGESGSIIVRGSNTMTGNTEPLIVLDGMPLQSGQLAGTDKSSSNINNLLTNGIGNIPPEDIESIDILRDATAASIYGARAANGVIIITTKRGEAGKDYINYSTKQTVVMKPKNTFSFMNSGEKIDFERDLYNEFYPVSGGRVNRLLLQADNGVISREDAESEIQKLSQINTDWIGELYSPAYQQSHNISMSGGSTKLQYNASINYQDSKGTLMENRNKQGGLNIKLTRNINDKLLVDFNIYSTLKNNVEGVSKYDPFRYAMFANPYEKPYNADGSYAWDLTYRNVNTDIGQYAALNYHTFNIVKELRENTLTNKYGNVRGQIGVEWKFLKNFQYRGVAVVDYTSLQTMDESRAGTYRSYADNWLNAVKSSGMGLLPKYNLGFLEENSGEALDYTIRNTFEYNQVIDNKHFLQGFLANEVQERTNTRFFNYNPTYLHEYRMAGYPSWDEIPKATYDRLDLTSLGGTFYDKNRSVSFISSFVYSYANKYVLNANFRADGVDIIGSDNQFTPLWSAGVKWNGHEEEFIKKGMPWLDRFVLSTGFGYTGSINRSVYPFHTYTLSPLIYGDIVKAQGFTYGNPVLKWERKRDINYGAEISVLDTRLNFEVNYYDNKVTDLLDNVRLPVSVGRGSSVVNSGILSNKGWEISTRIEAIKNADWLWEIGGNITTVKNNLEKVYYRNEPNVSSLLPQHVEGYAVNSWFGYKFDHINPTNGHVMAVAQTVDVNGNIEGEEVIDLSGISSADLQNNYRTFYLGQQNPTLYGGINTQLRYQNITMRANFVFAMGNKIMSFQDRREGPSGLTDDITAARTNRLKNQQYRWTQPGDITDIPAYSSNYSNYASYLITKDLEKGAYIKCTEVGFSWRANPNMFNKVVRQLTIGLYANNLFTISPYSGTDPEIQMAFGYPTTPSYIFSLNVGF